MFSSDFKYFESPKTEVFIKKYDNIEKIQKAAKVRNDTAIVNEGEACENILVKVPANINQNYLATRTLSKIFLLLALYIFC